MRSLLQKKDTAKIMPTTVTVNFINRTNLNTIYSNAMMLSSMICHARQYLKRKLTFFGLLVVLVNLLTACMATQEPAAPPIAQQKGAKSDYFIGVGDQLRINVWRNEDLSLEIPVRPDGKISVPLIGDITADKQTPEGLASTITERLQSYLKSPQVTVMVTNPSSVDFQRRVRVTGAVNTPLSMAFREGMTVLDLILLADGPNEYAALSRAKLYRKSKEGFRAYAIDLNRLLNKGNLDSNYALQPSDVISVPERLF